MLYEGKFGEAIARLSAVQETLEKLRIINHPVRRRNELIRNSVLDYMDSEQALILIDNEIERMSMLIK